VGLIWSLVDPVFSRLEEEKAFAIAELQCTAFQSVYIAGLRTIQDIGRDGTS